MNEKVEQLSDDNLISLLQDGRDENLVTRSVSCACLDELIKRYRELEHKEANPILTHTICKYCNDQWGVGFRKLHDMVYSATCPKCGNGPTEEKK